MINNPMVPGDPGMYDLKKLVCMVLRHDGLLTGLNPIVQEKVRVAADALEGELNVIRNDIANLEERVSEKVSGVTIGDTGVIMHGLVNIPYGGANAGVIKSNSSKAFDIDANGVPSAANFPYIRYLQSANDTFMSKGTFEAAKVYYVANAIASMGSTEVNNVQAKLGITPVKEWELKAEVTNPANNAFACDMSGCTEMMIYITGTNTATSILTARFADLTTNQILGSALVNGSRSTLAHYVACGDFATTANARYALQLNAVSMTSGASPISFLKAIKDIRQLYLSSAASSTNVNIKVYGR